MTSRKLIVLLAGALLFAASAIAQLVPPITIFQLDGNAARTPSNTCTYGGVSGQLCDYWNLLNGAGNPTVGIGTGSSPGHSVVRTFVNGLASTDNFTGGGSKDPNLISQWAYTSSSTPNKDTLNGAYAAAYNQGGDFEIIFGADRLSPNGDANIGIWFFQQQVGPNGSGGFTGAHVQGDLFIISAFTGGGGTSTVSVFQWFPACTASHYPTPVNAGDCADTNLQFLGSTSSTNPACGPTSPFCAITNSAATTTTWEGNLASPLFFEGGIDVSAAFRSVGVTTLPCFASFLVETRSSQSTSAVLKDFLAGGFPVCGLSITKSCGTPATAQNGTEINYPVNGVVTNTGVGTLFNVSVFDTETSPACTGTGCTQPQHGPILVVNNTTNSTNKGTSTLGANETGTWSDSFTTNQASSSDAAYAQGGLTSSITPNGSSSQSGTVTSSNTATATCTSAFNTPLTVTKNCGIPAGPNNTPPAVPGVTLSTSGSGISAVISYNGTVCNNGPSAVTGVVLTDTPNKGASAQINIGNLAACATFDVSGNCTDTTTSGRCVNYSSNYTATGLDQVITGSGPVSTGPGRYAWNNLITIATAHADIGTLCAIGSAPPCPQFSSPPAGTSGTFGFATAGCNICQGSGECTTATPPPF